MPVRVPNLKGQGIFAFLEAERPDIMKGSCKDQFLLFFQGKPELCCKAIGDIGYLLVVINNRRINKVHGIRQTANQINQPDILAVMHRAPFPYHDSG